MAAKKKVEETAVATSSYSEEALQALAELNAMFPQGDTFNRAQFPKLVFKSQDKFEASEELDEDGEPKMVQTVKAGTFFLEQPSEELDEDGKKKWDSNKIGKELSAHIIFHRKRLSYWDDASEEFYTTPIYDNDNEILPLFKGGEFVAEGTPAELKDLYPKMQEYTDKKTGEKKIKTVSHLKDAKVLYIVYNGVLTELTLQGTSLWSFNDYLRKNPVQSVITTISSSKEENGGIKWNKTTFKIERELHDDELISDVKILRDLQAGIRAEKEFYANKRATASNASDTVSIAAPAMAELPAGEEGF